MVDSEPLFRKRTISTEGITWRDFFGQLDLRLGGQVVVHADVELLVDGAQHALRGMPQDVDACAHQQVDVLVAVDIHHLGALPADHVDRVGREVLAVGSHTARQELARACRIASSKRWCVTR